MNLTPDENTLTLLNMKKSELEEHREKLVDGLYSDLELTSMRVVRSVLSLFVN